MRTQWEYKLVRMPSPADGYAITELLNEQGHHGWQLSGIEYGCFIFKREVQ